MIAVNPEDRDVLRFLWVEDLDAEEAEIITYRFSRVVFGVSSSPFLLNATIQHHVQLYVKEQPLLVDKVLESIYVDDVVGGADSEEEAYDFYKESKTLLREGSFNLRKFLTSSSPLQERVDHEETTPEGNPSGSVEPLEETYAETSLPYHPTILSGEQKVLGVRWNVVCDQLVFDFSEVAILAKDMCPTKRNVISIIGRFFDPLGYLSPVTIQFKVYMQHLCKSKLSWDENLTGETLDQWMRLVDQLRVGPPTVLPRCCLSSPIEETTRYRLYGFCDASMTAYAAVVYLAEETNLETTLRFVGIQDESGTTQDADCPPIRAAVCADTSKTYSERQ